MNNYLKTFVVLLFLAFSFYNKITYNLFNKHFEKKSFSFFILIFFFYIHNLNKAQHSVCITYDTSTLVCMYC